MRRPSLATILAEDESHNVFVRKYLVRLNLGLHDDEIRTERLPQGRGAGEQWVRQQYARIVNVHRRRAAKAHALLIVIIDADTGSVGRRIRQLEERLVSENMPRRGPDESIAHFIPKRNIETWILCLTGELVDEGTDYKARRNLDPKIGLAAAAFYTWTRRRAETPAHCIPSLSEAIPEARRLEQ